MKALGEIEMTDRDEFVARYRKTLQERAMGPSGRPGVFNDHNCWRCHSGELPCVNGNANRCEFLHARND